MSRFLSIVKLDERKSRACGGVLAGAAIAALIGMSAPACAKIVHLTAKLTGAQEVPGSGSKGTGALRATYDTKSMKLSWSLTYSGLSGPAIAAHFHGPAGPGKNAPILVPMLNVEKSPIKGSATITADEAKDLLDGMTYVNVHTQKHRMGEIRGQVETVGTKSKMKGK